MKNYINFLIVFRTQWRQFWKIRLLLRGYFVCKTQLQESSRYSRGTPYQRSNIPVGSVQRNSFVRWPDDDDDDDREEEEEEEEEEDFQSVEDFIGPENRIDNRSPLLLNSFF